MKIGKLTNEAERSIQTKHPKSTSLVIILIMTLLAGCANSSSAEELIKPEKDFEVMQVEQNEMDDVKDESIHSINLMAVELLQEMAKENQDTNILFSPTSLAFALAMLQNGAEGETKEGIVKVLQENEKGMNERYNLFMNYLMSLDKDADADIPGIKMNIANSLWLREDIKPKQAFVDDLNAYYNAQVFREDFSNKKTIDQMNQWVEDQTNKLLKGTIKEIAPETIAYLMNTVYFKGTWRNEFPESLTNKEAFYTTTQDSSFINMMHKTESLPYYEDELCQMTSLSYYGGSSMVVVLPKGDIDEYLKDLDDEILQNILVNGKDNNQRLQLSLPKLDIEVHNPLKELLANQGMEKAFSPNEAEFQSMIEVAGENVYVSDIFQNARIILDEKGTEAAAVTVVDMNVTSAQVPSEPIVFECNKPFLYIIKDDASGAILFVGIVRRP